MLCLSLTCSVCLHFLRNPNPGHEQVQMPLRNVTSYDSVPLLLSTLTEIDLVSDLLLIGRSGIHDLRTSSNVVVAGTDIQLLPNTAYVPLWVEIKVGGKKLLTFSIYISII